MKMKKLGLFAIGLFAAFGFMSGVKAVNGVSLKCETTTLKLGETTNCTVTVTSEATINAATITLSTSEYLSVSNVTANSAAGWTQAAPTTSATSATTGGEYAFNNTVGTTGGQLFSFNLTLNTNASKLGEGDSCGQLCISAATFNGNALTGTIQETGTCFAPTMIIDKCVGEDCNPKNPDTGTFMNYVVIAGALGLAVLAVIVAKRSSKFYKI